MATDYNYPTDRRSDTITETPRESQYTGILPYQRDDSRFFEQINFVEVGNGGGRINENSKRAIG